MIKDFGVGVYLPDQNSCYESTNFSVLLYIKINALMEWYIQNNLVKIIKTYYAYSSVNELELCFCLYPLYGLCFELLALQYIISNNTTSNHFFFL